MIRFNNDYNRGAFPSILEAMAAENPVSHPGYGTDDWCARATAKIRELTACPAADVHYFLGGTQANFVTLTAALTPVQSIIAADTGHINCHETAAVECAGHKILPVPNRDAKLTADQVRACAEAYHDEGEAEYLTEPKAVYISFPTEQGTLYTLEELKALRAVCREFGLYLFVDGARMSYGLTAPGCDVTLPDLAALADAFYLGGTKCGALFGEAMVLTAEPLKRRFKACMKQHGAVLAKGWLLGMQFAVMLESGEYFTAAKRANALSLRIRDAFRAKGIPFLTESVTNQQFVLLDKRQQDYFAEKYSFEKMGTTDRGDIIRFCTSWATTPEEVDALTADIAGL